MLQRLFAVLLCAASLTASAAPISVRVSLNPDNTLSTAFKCLAADRSDCKTPTIATLAWTNSCLPVATGLYTGTLYSEDVRGCLTGTAAATATITVVHVSGDNAASEGWAIDTDDLGHPGDNTGSGSFRLRATDSGDSADSAVLNWSFAAPPGGTDTTAPTKIVGCAVALNGSNQPVITCDAPVDPVVSGQPQSGLDTYTVYRNGSPLTPQSFAAGGLSPTFTSADIGSPNPAGSSSQSGADWMEESEGEIAGTADEFHFTYTPVAGDFSCSFWVESFTSAPSSFSKSACMARDGLAVDAPNVACLPRQNGSVKMQSRATAGATTLVEGAASAGYVTFPAAFQLKRIGNVYTCSASQDGSGWVAQVEKTLSFASTLNVGLATASVVDADTVIVQYRDVAVTNRAQISYTDTGATAGSTPSYTVVARDVVGNASTAGAAVSIQIPGGAASDAIKWHPGHYMLVQDTISSQWQATHFTQFQDIYGVDDIEGAQVRVYWSEIEPTQGNYNFSRIHAYLSELESNDKRLVLQILDRVFNSTNYSSRLPAYLNSMGCIHVNSSSPTRVLVKLWRADCMDRRIALENALAAEFDDEPYFEGITNEEVAPGINPGTSGADYTSRAELATQLKRLWTAMESAWQHTNRFAYINSLSGEVSGLLNHARDHGISMGGPDTLPSPHNGTPGDRTYRGTQSDGGYSAEDFRGTMSVGYAVQVTQLGGKEGTYTPAQLAEHCADVMECNHLFWVRAPSSSTINWASHILPYLEGTPEPMIATCPANYPSCDTSQILPFIPLAGLGRLRCRRWRPMRRKRFNQRKAA